MKTNRAAVCAAVAAAALAPLLAGPSAWAESPAGFRHWKPLARTASRQDEIVSFAFDADLYGDTRDGFPDLRIFDQDDVEAPYQVEQAVETRIERTRETFAVEVVDLREADDSLQIRLRLGAKSPAASGLIVHTPLSNFERKVRVEGSRDGAAWTSLATDGLIYDYSRFMDVSNREVSLPPNEFREFKLIVDDVEDEAASPFKELARTIRDGQETDRVERTTVGRRPFRIDRIEAWRQVEVQRPDQARQASYLANDVRVETDESAKQTFVYLHAGRQPLTSLDLATSSRNFSRRAEVQAASSGGAKGPWRQVAERTLFNLHFRERQREELTVEFAPRREETYRIVIHNQDNPPLDITGVSAKGIVHRAIFLAKPGKEYRVCYGSEMAAAPKYEAAAVLAELRRDYRPVEAALGERHATDDYAPSLRGRARGLLDNWYFLGAAIAATIGVLGWSLYRAGKKLEGK